MEDADCKELDSYTEAAAIDSGEITSDENMVNLPQTGNNSLKNLLLAVGAFMLTCFGFVAVMKSGVIRRRRDEQ
ncbi:MAG TPA: LPXTG cell wall anchor domain-containing protein [Ruminococcus sp.]|nr:LPXTG cell wall anchor domain-containing protein [Ruminococcus sp.]